MTKWKPIDTAPKGLNKEWWEDGERILVTDGKKVYIGTLNNDLSCARPKPYYDIGMPRVSQNRGFKPINWMPLPKPPKQLNKEK